MSYANPINACYTLKAATISAAATLLTIIGPPGKTGVLKGIGSTVTTSTTTAATLITAGTAADGDAFGTLSIPVATAGAASATNGATLVSADSALMAADTAVVIATDGGCDAGAADIFVYIDWF